MGVTASLRAPDAVDVERWAWAAVVANIVIVLTGGLVRLTGSGLGCPTWPQCTDSSFVPHRALGVHGVIEFGNRMLTYVLIAVVIATFVAVWRWAGTTRELRRLAALIALGVPFQGVIGGITVLTDLNPWVVSLHMILSMLLVAASMLLVVRVRGVATSSARPRTPSRSSSPRTSSCGSSSTSAPWSRAPGPTPATPTRRATASTRTS